MRDRQARRLTPTDPRIALPKGPSVHRLRLPGRQAGHPEVPAKRTDQPDPVGQLNQEPRPSRADHTSPVGGDDASAIHPHEEIFHLVTAGGLLSRGPPQRCPLQREGHAHFGSNHPVRVMTARLTLDPADGGTVDLSAKLDELQQRAGEAKAAAQAAASESREQLRQRIDQAKADVDQKASDARQDATAAAASAKSKWAEMKADAAAKLDDFEAKMERRADQRDAKLAARQADGAEADAADAIEFAAWTVDHARLGRAGRHRRPRRRRRPRQVRRRLVLSLGGKFVIQHPAKEAATMVGTVVFPTLRGLNRASRGGSRSWTRSAAA
jgi:hypothetical protein